MYLEGHFAVGATVLLLYGLEKWGRRARTLIFSFLGGLLAMLPDAVKLEGDWTSPHLDWTNIFFLHKWLDETLQPHDSLIRDGLLFVGYILLVLYLWRRELRF